MPNDARHAKMHEQNSTAEPVDNASAHIVWACMQASEHRTQASNETSESARHNWRTGNGTHSTHDHMRCLCAAQSPNRMRTLARLMLAPRRANFNIRGRRTCAWPCAANSVPHSSPRPTTASTHPLTPHPTPRPKTEREVAPMVLHNDVQHGVNTTRPLRGTSVSSFARFKVSESTRGTPATGAPTGSGPRPCARPSPSAPRRSRGSPGSPWAMVESSDNDRVATRMPSRRNPETFRIFRQRPHSCVRRGKDTSSSDAVGQMGRSRRQAGRLRMASGGRR